MGLRATARLAATQNYQVLACENDPVKQARLRKEGYPIGELLSALPLADFVILAVPDAVIAAVAGEIVSLLKPGAALIMLDAAAAYLGELPRRPDISQVIVHPCHPPIFTEQPTKKARRDYFGGLAFQDLLTCLMAGEEVVFQEAVEVARAVFAPIRQVHRVTVEQFAILEPAMAEIIVATAARWMREALEEAVAQGVPRAAAESFWAGHTQIALAIVSGAEPSPFSDAAQRAIAWGMSHYVHPGWRDIFRDSPLRQAIRDILHPQEQENA
jgi:hypothetical protein